MAYRSAWPLRAVVSLGVRIGDGGRAKSPRSGYHRSHGLLWRTLPRESVGVARVYQVRAVRGYDPERAGLPPLPGGVRPYGQELYDVRFRLLRPTHSTNNAGATPSPVALPSKPASSSPSSSWSPNTL